MNIVLISIVTQLFPCIYIAIELCNYELNTSNRIDYRFRLALSMISIIVVSYNLINDNLLFMKYIYLMIFFFNAYMLLINITGSFKINNNNLKKFYKIIFKIIIFMFFPFEIRNRILIKLYNIKIEKEKMPYINMIIILSFWLQLSLTLSIVLSKMESILNKYFFGFAIGTFVSYFFIDWIMILINRSSDDYKRYLFVLKKSFLIVLFLELIFIAIITNINYDIISNMIVIRALKMDKESLRELFDSITICTLVLQLIEYRE